tara:strand:- start:4215 stop:4415 length:201 start_codon:yes stop_codon:yes gene_type:complete
MSLQYLKTDREVVILCDNCGHNRGTFIYTTEPMSGIAECDNCSTGVVVHFLRDSKLSKFEKEDTNI